MRDDDYVCLCFGVTKRKIVNFCKRERPSRASLISLHLPAGTGCQWCVPFLKMLHQQCLDGVAEPDLPIDPERYAAKRLRYRQTGEREADEAKEDR